MGDPRLVRVPARDWPLNSTRNVLLSIADFPRAIAPERADEYATASRAHAELPWATPLGSIPQVPHTYAYWDIDYGLGNEHALVMAETTCSGRLKGAPIGYNGTAMFGIEELSKVALERCKTASCAVSLMGALAEEHGFYGVYYSTFSVPSLMGALAEEHGFYGVSLNRHSGKLDPWPVTMPGGEAEAFFIFLPRNGHLGKLDPWPGTMPGGEAEALAIGDAEGELWVFHILPGPGGPGRGAVWAAQRMAEDQVTVIANSFILRELDLADPTTSRASKDIVAVATELDFFDPDLGAPFDFTAAFGGNVNTVDPTGRKQLVGRFYAGRRIWRVFDLLAPGLSLDPDIGYFQERQTYPMGVAPEKLLSVRGFFAILRDHYEGTPFDMTVGPAAGPFGSSTPLLLPPFDITVGSAAGPFGSLLPFDMTVGPAAGPFGSLLPFDMTVGPAADS
ncbi:peptidase family C69-domain-containing protein [Pavlovales sp. CCMP2436]|nr:peptidase family C69-domain-containing protein [Pavlovales sp. CCMP2436]